MELIEKKKKYNCIDILKFVGSILVIAIHITPLNPDRFENVNFLIQEIIGRVVVPYFFIVSGFLLYSKEREKDFESKIIKGYLIKLIKIYIIWTIIYMPLILMKYDFKVSSIAKIARDFFISGSYGTLWYFNATIFAIYMIKKFSNKLGNKKTIFISIALYTIGLLGEGYWRLFKIISGDTILNELGKVYEMIFITTRNGLFEGIPLIFIGVLYSNTKKKIDFKKSICCFIISSIMLYIETILIRKYNLAKYYEMTVFMIPTSFFLFTLSLNINLKDKPIYAYLRKMSTIILLIHLLINSILGMIIKIFKCPINNETIRFAIVTLSSIMISYLIVKLSEKNKIKILRNLYS